MYNYAVITGDYYNIMLSYMESRISSNNIAIDINLYYMKQILNTNNKMKLVNGRIRDCVGTRERSELSHLFGTVSVLQPSAVYSFPYL